MTPATCPKCCAAIQAYRDETEECTGWARYECGSFWWSDHPFDQRPACRVRELEAEVATLRRQRIEMLYEYDTLSCDIASALNWEAEGKPFDKCIRELRAEVERLADQNAALLRCENACDDRMRKAAERSGVYTKDGKSWPECAADEIERLRNEANTPDISGEKNSGKLSR